MDWYAHWVGEGSDGGIIIDTGSVQGIEEVNEPVVYEFFQVEDELTNCSRDFSRVVPLLGFEVLLRKWKDWWFA